MPINNASKRIFLKPGKTNAEDRMNYVKYWAHYVRTHDDKEWSEQQNVLINSQLQSTQAVPLTREQYLKIKAAGKAKHRPDTRS